MWSKMVVVMVVVVDQLAMAAALPSDSNVICCSC